MKFFKNDPKHPSTEKTETPSQILVETEQDEFVVVHRHRGEKSAERKQEAEQEKEKRIYHEKDNRGKRIFRQDLAERFWNKNGVGAEADPFVRFVFEKELDASESLLGLSFIHRARDTGNLISGLDVVFGYYRREDGKFEAMISGKKFSHDLFFEAKKIFSSHGGQYKNEQRPLKEEEAKKMTPTREATFVKEYREIQMTGTVLFKLFQAPDSITARAFLNDPKRKVTEKDVYIVVETPEGSFYRDFFGVHEGERE